MNEMERLAVTDLQRVVDQCQLQIEELKQQIEGKRKTIEETREKQQQLVDLIEGIRQLSKD